MMRKNKFVNPGQKISDRDDLTQSPNNKDRNHPLMQNKIYFPSSYQDTLMAYKIQSSYQKDQINFDKIRSNQLYDIKERGRSKQTNQKRTSFGRQNRFQKAENRDKQSQKDIQVKGLLKYKTLQLKNLPGINYTKSGATIYRSKNIKSSGKLLLEKSISKRGRSQIRRNGSLRNDQSVQKVFPKSKSNKQSSYKHAVKESKGFMLYETYYSSKSRSGLGLDVRNNSTRSFQLQQCYEDNKEKIVDMAEDLLLSKVIQCELYPQTNSSFETQQQQFF